MDKHGLKPLTALGNDAPITIKIGPYQIAEKFGVALASLATRSGQQKAFAKAAKAAQIPLPAPGRFEDGKVFGAFWASPEQWMVEADFAKQEDIAAELKAKFGEAASITEQTDAWVCFDVSAPNLQPLIEKLSNIDFAKVEAGFATRTIIEHIGCYMIKRANTHVTIYGPRSSAQSLLHAIEVTAHSL